MLRQLTNTTSYSATHADFNSDVHNTYDQNDPIYSILFQAMAHGAAYDSPERHPPPKCHPGTRTSILKKIENWAIESTGRGTCGSVLWFHGPAGTGKSAITQTSTESIAARGLLGASFFFSRGHPTCNSVDRFIVTIASQLAMSFGDLRDQIRTVLREDISVLWAPMALQMERLIIQPLKSSPASSFVLIVDGVDECMGDDTQTLLLKHLIDLVHTHRLPIAILIVSRPEPPIKSVFDSYDNSSIETLSLYDATSGEGDILLYLTQCFHEIYNSERYSRIMESVAKPWPSQSTLELLASRSGGYFIYPTTLVKFVCEENCSLIDRLDQAVSWAGATASVPFAELDQLYYQILLTSQTPDLLKCIIWYILIPRLPSIFLHEGQLRRELQTNTTYGIESLLGLRSGEVLLALRGLHSLFSFKTSFTGNVKIHAFDASFTAFFHDASRSRDFFFNVQEHCTSRTITILGHVLNLPDALAAGESYELLSPSFDIDVLKFYMSRVDDLSRILHCLTTTNLSMSRWAPVVKDSRTWKWDAKEDLLRVFHELYDKLKALRPPPTDILLHLAALAQAFTPWGGGDAA